MVHIPQRLEDAPHDVFDVGLLNAAATALNRLMQQALNDGDSSPERIQTFEQLKVPWWLETKYKTPWELKDYQRVVVDRLTATLKEQPRTSIDVRDRGIQRLIQHWAHTLLYHSIPLHGKFIFPNTDVEYTSNDVLSRSREDMRGVAIEQYMEAESDEHPLWKISRYHQMTHRMRKVVETNTTQQAAAKLLAQPDFNLSNQPNSYAAEIIRKAVPELLSLEEQHLIILATDHRKKFRQLLDSSPFITSTLQRDLSDVMNDIWLQINPTSEHTIATMQEEGKPNVLYDDSSAVLHAYIKPHLREKNIDRLTTLIPLLSYHTMNVISMQSASGIGLALELWTAIASVVPNLPPRITDTALLACKIALSTDRDSPQILKRYV